MDIGTLSKGGILGWAGKSVWSFVQKRVERGQRLIDDAAPDLIVEGAPSTHYAISLRLRNVGKGIARKVRVGFTGVASEGDGGDVLPGDWVNTSECHIENAPFFRGILPAYVTVTYEDKFQNGQGLEIPVDVHPRNDGGVNPGVRWKDFTKRASKIGWHARYRIGS